MHYVCDFEDPKKGLKSGLIFRKVGTTTLVLRFCSNRFMINKALKADLKILQSNCNYYDIDSRDKGFSLIEVVLALDFLVTYSFLLVC